MTGWRSRRNRRVTRQPSLPGLLDTPGRQRLPSQPEQALERARLRLVVVLFMFGLLYAIIGCRVTTLTLLSDAPETPILNTASRDAPVVARADIVDRNGTVLATSLPTVSLCADSRKVIDAGEAISKLRTVLPDIDIKRLDRELQSAKRCALIRRHLTPKQYYEVNRLGIAGLEFSPDESRVYPAGRLTAHVTGYTDIDSNGIAGMEKSLNKRLQQTPQPVALSLDLRLQTILYRELSQAVNEFKALGGAGVIMDSRTGEILALTSLPDFDPQKPGNADDNAKFNRATLGVYEMGSTFKIFTAALGLDTNVIKPSDRFDTTNPIEAGRQTIRDFHPSKRPLNVAEIFMESSNIGAARIAEKIGASRQRAFLGDLGLTQKSSIELPEVGFPIVPSSSNWNNIATMTVAFGHGIAVNAVQLAAAVASIVNDGQKVRPTLLKRESKEEENLAKERVVSSRTSAQLRALMRLVVTDGTAKAAEVPGYIVAGKTGTADKLTNGQYNKNARLSSFIGVFPANAPRYLVFAMLDDPKGNAKTYGYATGGWTAAPIISRVVSQMGPLLDLPPQDPDVLAVTERQLLRPLGGEVLTTLKLNKDNEDYASVESNRAQ